MKNRITIKIQRKSYTLETDESNEYTENLAAALDRKISDKLSKGQGLSSLDAANLVAFECMDEIIKVNSNLENIRTRIKDYVDEADKARTSEKALQEQLEDAQRKINLLREKYAELFNEYKRLKSALRNGSQPDANSQKPAETAKTQPETNTETKAAPEAEKTPQNPQEIRQTAKPAQSPQNNSGNFVGMAGYNPDKKGQA